MSTVRAYYNGTAFVPIEPVNVPAGKIVQLSVVQDDSANTEIAERLASFRQITKNLRELNDTDPLPPEFDEIIGRAKGDASYAAHI